MDIVTYKLAQKYANKVAAGFSSVRVDGLNIIFTLNDGKTATVTVPAPKDGEDGVSITGVSLNQQSHLICTLSDGTAVDAGLVHQGVDGKDGEDGKDATINGYNSIELVAGENIRITQVGNQIIISATGVTPPTPTSDIQYITSDNMIFLTSDNLNFIVKENN